MTYIIVLLYYYRLSALRILQQSFTICGLDGIVMYEKKGHVFHQIYHKLSDSLESKQGRPTKMWSERVIVAWLALTNRTEMRGEPVFDIAWCC